MIRSLGARLALVSVLVVLLTSAALGALGWAALQQTSERHGRRVLHVLADQEAARLDAGGSRQTPLTVPLVRRGYLSADRTDAQGRPLVTGDPLARQSLGPVQRDQLRQGRPVSAVRRAQDPDVFVEARPLSGGGAVVLAQRRRDTAAQAVLEQTRPRLAWAVAGVALVGSLLALLVSWQVTRPLRRMATAATALSRGDREVRVEEHGPSEVVTVAREVNALAVALASSEARQREFLLSVSHDLRTPLTAIAGYAETLEDGGLDDATTRQVGSVLSIEAARLQRMVSDLLDLARLDADELRLSPEPVAVGSLVRAVEQAWRPRCEERGLALSATVDGAGLVVVADPGRLRQVVDNLLDNAVRVCPPGAAVVLAAYGLDGDVLLEVRDGGPGLAEEDLAVAFDRGVLHERYRGRREVGTGLGLALVDRLVRRSGGSVTVGRAPEGGACFSVRLPARVHPGLTVT